ncbi:hypothetical protein ROZALSC1DRAFT_28908 [Rozella allomycis CSF55]|uniref:Uncharacterized protein n=1 Tax=Rozella allomycis (strain CSF55) TaxID=988480 RepID=A0A075APX7_ROZAC|nr:hypothetical protein O9G_002590 [Rozella allomycis CSF55]RKP19496.1 hypothetical protein ROZALSC1DRAFT_28908 [Rozella allomycis CSF55]|eukprot:EPZ32238.1 hypothetical protein O9G_002590 [Rozella allomycis CSF55]
MVDFFLIDYRRYPRIIKKVDLDIDKELDKNLKKFFGKAAGVFSLFHRRVKSMVQNRSYKVPLTEDMEIPQKQLLDVLRVMMMIVSPEFQIENGVSNKEIYRSLDLMFDLRKDSKHLKRLHAVSWRQFDTYPEILSPLMNHEDFVETIHFTYVAQWVFYNTFQNDRFISDADHIEDMFKGICLLKDKGEDDKIIGLAKKANKLLLKTSIPRFEQWAAWLFLVDEQNDIRTNTDKIQYLTLIRIIENLNDFYEEEMHQLTDEKKEVIISQALSALSMKTVEVELNTCNIM